MALRHLNVKQSIEGLGKDTGQALVGGERSKDKALPQDSSQAVSMLHNNKRI
jgi:hypothetical protein